MANLIPCKDGTMADPSIGCVSTPSSVVNPDSSIVELILKISGVLMTLAAGIAVIMLIYGGIIYAMAAGDEDKIKNAKRTMIWSVIGLVVAILAKYGVEFVLKAVV